MDIGTVKKYLRQLNKKERECDEIRDRILEIKESDISSASFEYSGNQRKRRRSSRTEDRAVKLMALEKQYYSCVHDLIDFRHEIIGCLNKMICALDDEDLGALLFYRYVEYLNFTEIHKKLKLEYHYTTSKHVKALEAFGEMFENDINQWISEHNKG